VHGGLGAPAQQPGSVQRSRRTAVDGIEQRQQPELLDGDRHAGRVGTTGASAFDQQHQAGLVVAMPRSASSSTAFAQQLQDGVCHRSTLTSFRIDVS
jgi:hypothetical protein